ncbi:MAG: glycosyltransferase, partial [Candidatus Woesearchaeota archaeon]|nr:glycosyltransferase [Candidatus Woesearchaeota archaeon]
KGIIYKDDLNQKGVVQVINAADIVVIPNTDNAFTKYCFPYKCVEYMACNTPIVATNVGDVGIFLKQFPHTLCKPDDVEDLKEKLKYKLTHEEKIDYRKHIKKNTWDAIAEKLNTILKQL